MVTKLQVLIIDDDPIIQLMLKAVLQDQGYEVLIAHDGEEGLLKARQHFPALIICDWLMPGMTGLEVCRQVKADPALSKIFFILLTGRVAVEDRVEGLDTGADDFLPKPIEVNELRARVRAGLRLYQSAQELQKLAHDLKIQKQVLEAELAEAADYVKSLLPPPMIGNVTIDTRFLPSRQLGGDCFDYYWLDPDYLVLYVLDMSGHGLGSALPSVFVQNLLRSKSLSDTNFYQPNEVLKALNEIFQMDSQNERYFTIWYGVYNQKKRQLVYASAGHPPAVVLSRREEDVQAQLLNVSGTPIGMLPDRKYTNAHCTIEESGTLYLFSDGIYEIKQPNGKIWDLDGFIQLLIKHSYPDDCTLDDIVQYVQWVTQTSTFEDDCSLIQVKFK